MAAAKLQLDRMQQHHLARFREMGLSARPMPDGRSLLVSLPLGPAPFESLNGPILIERVIFATIGVSLIKCLRPRPVFGLPLLDIRDAQDPVAIEGVIRGAWRERIRQLREASRWFADRGLDANVDESRCALGFALPGESPDTRVRLNDRNEVILPGTGPLSGIAVPNREARLIPIASSLESGSDIECLIAGRIDALRRDALKTEANQRTQRAQRNERPEASARATAPRAPLESLESTPPSAKPPNPHHPKVLVVGQRLIENAALRDALRRRQYRTATARSESEALARLASMTPDLVLSEFGLGRSDGAALIHATRAVAGIERIPVVLLDDTAHPARREAAQAVGAIGYVIGPKDPEAFVARLERMLQNPAKRRYTRYPGRLGTRLQGLDISCIATEVSRGGIFVLTDADIATHSALRAAIALPELGCELEFEGEVLYRSENQGGRSGLGLRFHDLTSEDEASLIAYITQLESLR